MQNRSELIETMQELMHVESTSLVEDICLKFSDEELSAFIPSLKTWNVNPRYLFENHGTTKEVIEELSHASPPPSTHLDTFQDPYAIATHTYLTLSLFTPLAISIDQYKEQRRKAQATVKKRNKIKGVKNNTLFYKLKTQSIANAPQHKTILLLAGAEPKDIQPRYIDAYLVYKALSSEAQEAYTSIPFTDFDNRTKAINIEKMRAGLSCIEEKKYQQFLKTNDDAFAQYAALLDVGELVELPNTQGIYMRQSIRTFKDTLQEIAKKNIILRAALTSHYERIANKE